MALALRRSVAATMLGLLPLAIATAPLARTSPSVRNVVFTLLRGDEDGALFAEEHMCLQRALALGEAYDLVAFHERELTAAAKARMRARAPTLRFVDISDAFAVPAHVTLPPAERSVGGDLNSVGYRQMCSFMANDWYRLLANYEYAMRVDDDVCLQPRTCPPCT